MIIVNGNNEPSKIKVGSKDVQAVYSGSKLVWPKHPYHPKNLELVSVINVPGPMGSRYGKTNTLCIDNPNRWLLFNNTGFTFGQPELRNEWYYSDDQGSTWTFNNNKPDGWNVAEQKPQVAGVSWNGSVWLAYGSGHLVMWSSDGIAWQIIDQQGLRDFFDDTVQVYFGPAAPRADGSWWVYGKVTPPLAEDQEYPIAIRVLKSSNNPNIWENMPSGAPINPDVFRDPTRASYVATGAVGTPQNDYVCVNWRAVGEDTRNKFTHRNSLDDMQLVRRSDEGYQTHILYHSVDGWSGFVAKTEDYFEFSESNENWNKAYLPVSSGKNPRGVQHMATDKVTGQVFVMGYSKEGSGSAEKLLFHLYLWHPQTGFEKTGWCSAAEDLQLDPNTANFPQMIYSQGNRFVIQTYANVESERAAATYVYKWKQS